MRLNPRKLSDFREDLNSGDYFGYNTALDDVLALLENRLEK